MRDLGGRVAVVTGGASGIGFAMAQRFAASGMRLAIGDVEEEALAKAEAQLAADGAEVLAVRTDVGDGASVDALRDAVADRFGTWHVVCNNAGVSGPGKPAWELTEADWRWTIGVNLWGVLHGVRAFVPRLVEQGEGHVVNTASIFGHMVGPRVAPYFTTKHAVVALSEVLHLDLQAAGSEVGVTCLCPGLVATNLGDSERNRPDGRTPRSALDEAAAQAAAASYAESVVLPPDQVAEQVVSAVQDGRFWVFTHPHLMDTVRLHHEAVQAGLPPTTEHARL